jgi:hypothetical protein
MEGEPRVAASQAACSSSAQTVAPHSNCNRPRTHRGEQELTIDRRPPVGACCAHHALDRTASRQGEDAPERKLVSAREPGDRALCVPARSDVRKQSTARFLGSVAFEPVAHPHPVSARPNCCACGFPTAVCTVSSPRWTRFPVAAFPRSLRCCRVCTDHCEHARRDERRWEPPRARCTPIAARGADRQTSSLSPLLIRTGASGSQESPVRRRATCSATTARLTIGWQQHARATSERGDGANTW